MKIMLVGHRPDKLDGYTRIKGATQKQIEWKLNRILDRALIKARRNNQELIVVSGMAQGVDQWIAALAIQKGIRVHAYIPFKDYGKTWPKSAREEYEYLLKRCSKVEYVSAGEYKIEKMHKRNQVMIGLSDYCIAIWDGTSGRTANCVSYMRKIGKPHMFIHPTTLQDQWVITSQQHAA